MRCHTERNGKCEDYISDYDQGQEATQNVNCHMVFDIEMEDFQRKACLVTGGHITNTPDTIIYSIVVTRETVCIAIIIAAL